MEHDEFYSASCYIGSYDGANCRYGYAPTGTTAFTYPGNTGNFYYTPTSGNNCPYPGSYFDGANCFVVDITDGTYGFIYQNGWYTKPKKRQTY